MGDSIYCLRAVCLSNRETWWNGGLFLICKKNMCKSIYEGNVIRMVIDDGGGG
jgi:hypothetical protein